MKRIFTIVVLSLAIILNAQGQVAGDFRSKATGPGNWNDFNAWETYNGSAWVAATSGQLPTATSAVEIRAAQTMVINAAALASGNLTINGTLNYDPVTVSTLTANGNVVIGATGSFTSPASGIVTTHSLNLNGDLTINGVFDMNVFSTAGVTTTFTGAANNVIAGTGPTQNFYNIVVNKGVVYTNVLDVTSVITLVPPPITGGMKLTITNGTFKVSSASTLSPYAGTQTLLTANGRLWLNNAAAVVQSVGVATAAGTGRCLITAGRLQITHGTFSYGSGSDIHSIAYSSTYLTLENSDATLNLYGSMQLGYGLNFTMSAGNVNIYPQAGNNLAAYWPVSMESYFLVATNYQLTGGTLTIVDPTLVASGSYSTSFNCVLSNGTFNLSGLTLRLGDGVSDKAGTVAGFSINSNVPIGNVIVNNSPSSVSATRIAKLSGAFSATNLTINGGTANQFQLNGFVLTLSGNMVNSGTFNGDGSAGNGITFNGTTQQVISGTGTFTNNNINTITVNSTSVSSPSVDLQVPLSVSNFLTLTSGTLGTTNSSAFTIGRPASSTTFSMTRSGGSLTVVPAYSLAGVTGSVFTYNAPTPAAAQTTGNELPPAFPIATFTINNASGVTLNKAVSCTALNLTTGILTTSNANLITVTGTATTSITGGSATAYISGPLARMLPSNAVAANYKFPVGKSAYHLFEYETITTTGSGTATFMVESFDAGPYPGTAGTGMATINTDKFWELSAALGSVVIGSSRIRITEAGLVSTNKIGQSNIVTGSFNNIGGILGTGTISSRQPIDYSNLSAGTYFRIGTMGTLAAGNYAVGPSIPYSGYAGSFLTFQNAVDALADVSPGGNIIFEFQNDYSPAVEVYPVVIPSSFSGTALATLTFRPSAAVSSIINFSTAGTIVSNTGADYLIFDGRNGGTGTNKLLQFTSTSTTLPAISISGDALNNQFLYCILKGSNTSSSSGIVALSAPVTGNNNLTVNNCNFDGSGSAGNCLYGTGTATGAVITFNNFFNYRNGGGIYFTSGSTNGIIDNNNFYQTTAYNASAGTAYGIYLGGGDNCQISNNNIGGSGPALAGTWTVSSATPVVCSFTGILASCGSTVLSKLYNNKVQNFNWVTNAGATWTGISVGGLVNAGTDGANYVGNNTTTGNILVTCYNAGTLTLVGIATGGTTGSYVENNFVGSMTAAANGAVVVNPTIYAVKFNGSQVLRNNIIGSATVAQSINTTTTGGTNNISGVFCQGGLTNITGNTIANLYTGAATGMIRGIDNGNYGGLINFSSNTIFNLTTTGVNTGTGTSASIIGIYDGASGTSGLNTISGNTIYNLVNTGAGAVSVYGIYYVSSNGGTTSIMDKNLVHSFNTTSNTAIQMGIVVGAGTIVVKNNVVRLGIDVNGNPITSTAQITGMSVAPSTGCCVAPAIEDVYFNTVYVGGTGVVAGTVKSYAFVLVNHGNYSGAGLGEEVRDNIFVNVRTNAVANLLNYAISLPAPMAGVPSLWDYNIYQVSTTDGKLAVVGGVDNLTIGTLSETYPGNDLHSGFGNPLLTSPASAMATMNLKPANLTPAEGNGIAIASVTDDFAGLVRSAYTPTDIGAYAGNFTPAGPPQDIFFPIIAYNPLGNTSITTGRTTHNFATITDVFTGVNTTSGTRPRIYYKISTNANAFVGNTSADNGWKWVEATGTTSPFNFTIDYSILFGGPVVLGTVIQYFVVAQDLATVPNLSFKPATGASGTNVAPAGMTAPATPNSYKIVPLLANSLNVGTGYPYLTLTGTGGLFDAINNSVIDANTVAYIKTDITEPGTVSLNLVSEQGAGEGTLTLTVTSDGTAHLLSGGVVTANAPMIPITGATRFYIDGGASKLLTLRNSSGSGGPVVQYNNSSQADTLKNCYIESNAQTVSNGAVTIGSTGINKIGITNCDIRDARGGTLGSPITGIYSNSPTNLLTVTNNNIYNFKTATTYLTAYGLYLPNVAPGCTVTGNSFYMESGMNPACIINCIYFQNTNSHMISGNFIGGSAPLCGGSPLTTSNPITFTGIYTYFTTAPNITIQGNTIQNISMTSTGAAIFYGINNYEGPITVTGNTIGSATIASSIQLAGSSASVGIYNSYPSALFAGIFEKNTVANITLNNLTGSPNFTGMKMEGGTVRMNKIFSIGGSVAAATPVITGIANTTGFATNEFSNNMIALNGGASTNPTLYGFSETSAVAGTTNFYYNSINLYGTSGGANSSYAYYRTGAAGYALADNILANQRTGGTGKHYAIFSTPVTGFVSDYNDLYVAGAVLGSWGGVDKANLAAWKAIVVVPLLDVNSLSTLPAFTSNSNLYIVTDSNLANHGTPVSVTVDIDGVTRCVPPDIGANKFGTCTINLNLTVFLESLYAGAGMMNAATSFNGVTFVPKWGPTIADHITVELHNMLTYATVIYTATDIPLNTNGTATIPVPGTYNGTYYITVKHKTSLETVSAVPVLFNTSTITYNMSDLSSKAFGGNLKALPGGVYAIYAGDVSSPAGVYPAAPVRDGVVDIFDDFYVYSSFLAGDFGYMPADVNGDGVVDLIDTYMVYTNYLLGVYAITP
ncbi:MAG: hypothetical protein NTW10_10680 [Bacteroidetes bacterium]|nr:hypothetical protein [Bacteroidota bacterium]